MALATPTANGPVSSVVVVGAGITGLTTAYFLAKAGHSVTVLEQQSEKAKFEWPSAALLSPSHAVSVLSPENKSAAVARITQPINWFRRTPTGHADFTLSLDLVRWAMTASRYCTGSVWANNSRVLNAFAHESTNLTLQIANELQVTAADSAAELSGAAAVRGRVAIYEHEKPFNAARARVDSTKAVIKPNPYPYRALTPNQCMKLAPTLHPLSSYVYGGLLHPTDRIIDSRKFRNALLSHTRSAGRVAYRFDTTVTGLVRDDPNQPNRATGVSTTTAGTIRGDRFVFCTGARVRPFFLQPPAATANASAAALDTALTSRALPLTPIRSHSLAVYVPEFDPTRFALRVESPSAATLRAEAAAAERDSAAYRSEGTIWVHPSAERELTRDTHASTASIHHMPSLSTNYVARPRVAIELDESRTLVVPQSKHVVLSTGNDLTGYYSEPVGEVQRRLTESAKSLFPHITDSHLKTFGLFRVRLSGVSADGLPLIGAVPPYSNVYVNTAHGPNTQHWTLAAASAKLCTALIGAAASPAPAAASMALVTSNSTAPPPPPPPPAHAFAAVFAPSRFLKQ